MKDIRASIDIGSNSVLLLVAEVKGRDLFTLERASHITSLGKDLDRNKSLLNETMDATYTALKEYAEICDRYKIDRDKIIITATEAARVASNAMSFSERIQRDLGLKIKIITSKAEAYFSAKGILCNSTFDTETITIMDIGGASTELIRIDTKRFSIIDTISLPVGAVRATNWLNDDVFVASLHKIFTDYRVDLDKFNCERLYCVAGTVTSLGNIFLKRKEFVEDDVHGLVIKNEEVVDLFKKYSNWTTEQYNNEFPFLQKRANSIRGGLHVVYHMLNRLAVREVVISTFGLRYGTLLEGQIKQEYLYGK